MIPALPGLAGRLKNCRGTLIDSNILIDVASADPHWSAWSTDALSQCADHGPLILNPIVYAEVSMSYQTIDDLESALPTTIFEREPLPWAAGFLAGRSFLGYRRRGGTRTTPLPDFYIGAHAAVSRLALLTRDTARFRTYFPTVVLLTPAEAQTC